MFKVCLQCDQGFISRSRSDKIALPTPSWQNSRHAPPDPGHHPHRRTAPQPRARARKPRRTPRSGPWSRPMPTATASSARSRACARADGFALLDLQEAQRVRDLGWRGPILLLEGVFEPRDLELCSRLDLWHTVHCDEQIDMLAMHKTHQPHRVFLKMNSGHEPARLFAAALSRRLDPAGRAAAGRRDFADDALQRRRRGPAASRASCRCSSDGDARPAGRTHAVQQRRDAALRRASRRCAPTGSGPGIARLRQLARSSRCTTSRTGTCSPTMTLRDAHHRGAAARARRSGRLRLQLPADAPLRIGVAACGYADGYPRSLRHRHAGAGGRRAHPHRRPGQHGHDRGGPHAGAARRLRQRSHAVGPRRQRRRAGDRRAPRARPAHWATS